MHAVPAFDDHTADDELGVHALPARIAEVLRNNEYRLNARGLSRTGMPFRYIRAERGIFHDADFNLAKASNLDDYGTSILASRCRHSVHVI